jgi:transposase
MAGITVTNEKGCLRLYRTFSYRDNNNKPQRTRKSIGKVDLKTGKVIFNNFFKYLLLKQNINIEKIENLPYHDIPKYVDFGICSKEDLINRSNKDKDIIEDKYSENYIKYNNNTLIEYSNNNKEIKNNENSISQNEKKLNIEIFNGKTYSITEKNISVKSIGPKYILEMIIGQTGLSEILQKVFPTYWDKIVTLAFYLVSDNAAIMYCQHWLENNESILQNNCNMSSQRISELLNEIKIEKILEFWEEWSILREEKEYLALDITSISSYANLINELEFGYNRDGEKLPQINLCMLFGEESGLPVLSSIYNGSLNDSKILRSFLEKLEFFGEKKYRLVMDKGFYSKYNIMYMLKKYPKYEFMIAVPFTTAISKSIVTNSMVKLEEDLSFNHNNDTLMGYSFIESLSNDHNVIYHVIYNEYKYLDAKKCIKERAIELRNEAIANPEKFSHEKEHKKYLIFHKDKINNCYDIKLNLDRIYFDIRNAGWFIIASSNLKSTYKEALTIYRNKDIVEKAFNNLKNSLSLKRLHVHKSQSLNGKMFIAMISLIISSYINNIIDKNNLYKNILLLVC